MHIKTLKMKQEQFKNERSQVFQGPKVAKNDLAREKYKFQKN